MHLTLRSAPCLLGLALAFPAPAAPLPPPRPLPEVKLAVGLQLYRAGDEATFTRTVTNRTKGPVAVYPFRFLNDHVRFHWRSLGAKEWKTYGDGKSGEASPLRVAPGKVLTEELRDDTLTARPGVYEVYVSSRLADGTRLKSNVVEIRVVDPDDD